MRRLIRRYGAGALACWTLAALLLVLATTALAQSPLLGKPTGFTLRGPYMLGGVICVVMMDDAGKPAALSCDFPRFVGPAPDATPKDMEL